MTSTGLSQLKQIVASIHNIFTKKYKGPFCYLAIRDFYSMVKDVKYMYQELLNKNKQLAVIGLGYVGLPIALAFAKKIKVIGFDSNPKRVDMLKNNIDPSQELEKEALLDIPAWLK